MHGDRLAGFEMPESLLEFVLSRIGFLGGNERDVLGAAAAVGKGFDLDLLFGLCDHDRDTIVGIVDSGVRSMILEPHPSPGGGYVFSHDRVRRALYDSIDEPRRVALHLRIARTLERLHREDLSSAVFDIAHHCRAGRDAAGFLKYAVPAGVIAMERYALDEAHDYFRTAAAMIGTDRNNPLWLECRVKLGIVETTIGNYGSAVAWFREALAAARDPALARTITLHLSDALYREGSGGECEAAALDGLKALRERFPGGRTRVIAGIVRELAVHLALEFCTGRAWSEAVPDPARRTILGYYQILMHNYAFHHDAYRFLYTALRMANVSMARGELSREFAISIYGLGLVCMNLGFLGRTKTFFDRGRAASERIGDRWAEAYYHGLMGYVVEHRGEPARAIDEYYRKCLSLFQGVGDSKYCGMAISGMARAYYCLSDYEASLRYNDIYGAMGEKSGDRFLIGTACINYAMVYREKGDINRALWNAARGMTVSDESKMFIVYCPALIEMGALFAEQNDYRHAIACLEKARGIFRRENVSLQYVGNLHAYLAEYLVRDSRAKLSSLSRGERARTSRRIAAMCRVAFDHASRWTLFRAHAFRAYGLYLSAFRPNGDADAAFLKSIELAGASGRLFEQGKGYLDYGLHLLQRGRQDESRRMLETACMIFDRISARQYLLQAGRLLGMGSDARGGAASLKKLVRSERRARLKRLELVPGEGGGTGVLMDAIGEYAGAQGAYYFARTSGGRLELGAYTARGNAHSRAALMRALAADVPATGGPARFDAAAIVARARETRTHPPHGSRAIGIPVNTGGGIAGVFCLDEPFDAALLSDDELASIQGIVARAFARPEAMAGNGSPGSRNGGAPALNETTRLKMEKAAGYAAEHFASDISRDGLAESLDLSPNYFGKLFQAHTGCSFGDYVNNLRIERARALLSDTDEKIIEIAYSVGFENLRTFNRVFRKKMKMTPQEYRRGRNR